MHVIVAVELPLDLSDLEAAIDMAKRDAWEITLVHVMSPLVVSYGAEFGAYIPPAPIDTTALQEELDQHAAELRERGLSVEAKVVVGAPVHAILRTAESLGATLIVALAKQHNLVHRVVLGSVLSSLIKASSRPLLVLPSREQTDAGLNAAVDRLFDLADRNDGEVDLTEVNQALAEHRADPESEKPRHGLHNALERVQRDHPDLVQAANDISYFLSGMGI